jgi:hypothetical protein
LTTRADFPAAGLLAVMDRWPFTGAAVKSRVHFAHEQRRDVWNVRGGPSNCQCLWQHDDVPQLPRVGAPGRRHRLPRRHEDESRSPHAIEQGARRPKTSLAFDVRGGAPGDRGQRVCADLRGGEGPNDARDHRARDEPRGLHANVHQEDSQAGQAADGLRSPRARCACRPGVTVIVGRAPLGARDAHVARRDGPASQREVLTPLPAKVDAADPRQRTGRRGLRVQARFLAHDPSGKRDVAHPRLRAWTRGAQVTRQH